MRRILLGSLGAVLSAVEAAGQSPGTAPPQFRPAARIGGIESADAVPASWLVPKRTAARAQTGVPVPGGPPPVISPPPPAGGGPGLPQARPFGGPTITETRNGAGTPAPTPGGQPGTPPAWSYLTPTPNVYGPAPVGPDCPPGGPAPALEDPLFGGSCFPGGVAATSAFDKWWVSGEYLMWWTRSAGVPPLVTTSSPAFNGIPGTGDTRVLFGNGTFGNTLHSGVRVGAGHWFGCDQRWGIDGSLFVLGRNGEEFRASSAAFPTLARPFVNLNQGVPFSELVTSPVLATGGVAVNLNTSLWGAEANVRRRLSGTGCARLDLLTGFRFLNLDDELRVTEVFTRVPNAPTAAISGTVFDQFRTENRFYGGQVGLAGEARRGRWFVNGTGKVALGTVFQQASISGGQSLVLAGVGPVNTQGGLLALPGANIGTFTQNKFAVVPEVGLNVGYHVTPHARVFVGYNFLYLSSVLRPGDQIDPGVDVTRIPNFPVAGATRLPVVRPAPTLRDSTFFAQGLNFGLQFTW